MSGAPEKYAALFAKLEDDVEYRMHTAVVDFTEELSRRMEQLGMSRKALADKYGCSPAFITKVLRGTANFKLETMTRLAMAVESDVRIHLAPTAMIVIWEDIADGSGSNHARTASSTFLEDSRVPEVLHRSEATAEFTLPRG